MSGKRWIALGIFVVLLFVYVFVQSKDVLSDVVAADREWKEEVYQQGGLERIAMLTVEGTIIEDNQGSMWGSPFYNHRLFLKQLEHAFGDPSVRAIVIRINSPGGGIVESDEVFHKVMELKEEYQKPVVVSMGRMAASGGYYIAAAADKIFANRGTLTGSIGVISSVYNVKELADEWGIKEEAYTSGPLKNMLSPLQETSPEEEAILQELVDEMYQNFVDVIVEGRGMERSEVLRLADGRIYSGQQAHELGLIDGLGFLDDAIEEAADLAGIQNPTVVSYVQSGWSRFNTLFAKWGKAGSTEGIDRLLHDPAHLRLMYLMN